MSNHGTALQADSTTVSMPALLTLSVMEEKTCPNRQVSTEGSQREVAAGYVAPLASAKPMLLTTFKPDGLPVSTAVQGVSTATAPISGVAPVAKPKAAPSAH